MIVDKINAYLSQEKKTLDEGIAYAVGLQSNWVFKRQFMTDEKETRSGDVWLSGVGKCPRQLAYQFHGVPKSGKELDGRSKMVFWQGDLAELMIVYLARLAGVKVVGVGNEQLRLVRRFKKKAKEKGKEDEIFEAVGKPDGIVFSDDPYYENGQIVEVPRSVLLEVKSMSSYKFREFSGGNIG